VPRVPRVPRSPRSLVGFKRPQRNALLSTDFKSLEVTKTSKLQELGRVRPKLSKRVKSGQHFKTAKPLRPNVPRSTGFKSFEVTKTANSLSKTSFCKSRAKKLKPCWRDAFPGLQTIVSCRRDAFPFFMKMQTV